LRSSIGTASVAFSQASTRLRYFGFTGDEASDSYGRDERAPL
jgi:hypothetical protein